MTHPTPDIAPTVSSRTSIPFTSILPESGWNRLVHIFSVVLLPEPFGPRSAVKLPSDTANDAWFTAWNPLNVFTTSSTTSVPPIQTTP